MKFYIIICIIISLSNIMFNSNYVQSARILATYPTISRSHYIVAEALLIELANRGHQVKE